jgi:hypothetical protein
MSKKAKELWGDDPRGPAVSYPDDTIAQASRTGGEARRPKNVIFT